MVDQLLAIVVTTACLATGLSAQTTRSSTGDDLDHPWQFKPAFRDRTEWERRARSLRTQVLVAAGLWPMPARDSATRSAIISHRLQP